MANSFTYFENHKSGTKILSGQKVFHFVFVYNCFFEGVSTCFGAAYSLNYFAPVLCFRGCFLVFCLNRGLAAFAISS